jgi:hypothetical protein
MSSQAGARMMITVFSTAPVRGVAIAAMLASLAAGVAPPASAQSAAPRGSYIDSCTRIGMDGYGTLTATCRTVDGDQVVSSINHADRCDGDIWNRNGQLGCEKREHDSNAAVAVGALAALAVVAAAASSHNSANAAPPAGSTRDRGGYHAAASNCPAGQKKFLAFQMGGDPNRPWAVILDNNSNVELYLPQGTTESKNCGSPPVAGQWAYTDVK